MFFYYLRLAIKSIRSTPVVSLITLLAISLGIAVSTTILTVYRAFDQNPIPEKSEVLHYVRMDSWDPNSEFYGVKPGAPPKQITYRDMVGIKDSDLPKYATAVGTATAYAFPEQGRPFQSRITLCNADLFALTEAPFRFGQGWTDEADRNHERVTVLSHEGNQQFFGGENSVGKTVRLGKATYTVIGVLKPWSPTPLFYDLINNGFGKPYKFFIPFDIIRERQALGLNRVGDSDSWGNGSNDPDFLFTGSETCWIQYWVELEPNKVAAYSNFIDNYTREQKALGRFARPLNNRVTPLMEWLADRNQAADMTRVLVMISLLFLLVCALNLTGLLLGKFLARANRVGVQRALGASRFAVFTQHIVECELVGILGGLLGVVMAWFSLGLIGRLLPSDAVDPDIFRLSPTMLLVAFALALLASLIAGIYPAWRACTLSPAVQVKLQ